MKFDQKTEVFISREELVYFVRKYRFSAGFVFLSIFLGVLIFFGNRPHEYSAKAQFSFVNQKSSPTVPAQFDFFNHSFNNKSPAGGLSLLTSQQLLTEVIEEAGLQIQYSPKKKLAHSMLALFEHLKIEIGILPVATESFTFSHVKTTELRQPHKLILRFQSMGDFDLIDEKRQKIGKGKIGEPVTLNDTTFTLQEVPSQIRSNVDYSFIIIPLEKALSKCKKCLTLKPDKEDPNTYHVLLSAPHRAEAKRVLNILFSKYELNKRRLHLDILSKDIEEIQNEEQQLRKRLFERLEERAKEYSNQIGEGQFIDAQSEIEILHSSKKACLEKLFELEVLLSRLEEKNSGLHSQSIDLGQNIQNLGNQIQRMVQIEQKISSDPKTSAALYLFANDELGYASPAKAINTEEVSRLFATQIISHLRSKKALFETTSDALLQETKGKIDLTLGQNLLSDHYRKIFEMESLSQQLAFLKGELLRPDFEVSSMSSLLSDPFLQSLLKGTAELSLQLHDLVNHTSREQDRIRDSIAFTKQFLNHHLRQKIDLLQLELQLTRMRAERIQNGMIEQIRSEKSLLEKKIHLVQQEVAELPNKWLLENYFAVESDLTKNLLSTFVSIEQNKMLEKITFHSNFQIIDPVFVMTKPRMQYTLPLAAMAGIFSVVLYLSFQLALIAQRGFPVSQQLIKANNLKMISEKPDQWALWLASQYENHSVVTAVFADEQNCEELARNLKEMGFTAMLWKMDSALVGEKNFSQKIAELRQNFDFILLVSDDLKTNVEKCALLRFCDLSLIFCRNQTTLDFNSIFDWVQQKGVDHVAFTFKSSKAHS